MNDQNGSQLKRRAVFAGVGAAGALAGVAALLPSAPAPVAKIADPQPVPDPAGGYQLTQHVLRYYETTRI